MHRRARTWRGRALLLLVGGAAAAVSEAGAQGPLQSFDLTVPEAPMRVTIDGTTRLVYELHITNFAADTIRLTRLDVLDADSEGRPLAAFEGEGLARLLGLVGSRDVPPDPREVAPGRRAVAYLWLRLGPDGGPHERLLHRLTFRAPGSEGAVLEATVGGGEASVSRSQPPVLAPPLRGGPWVAVYLPEASRGHRRVLYALDGRVHIPARFAIDWMKIDAAGRLAGTDAVRVSQWHGYGAEVLAVAAGTVVAMRDSIPEERRIQHVPHGLAEETGNHVTLDIGDGRYVSYEHLRPGSITVSPGDRVQVGQVIAQVGYTGDSGGPHLHMHVSDGSAPLDGEGLPFLLTGFEYLGGYSFGAEPGAGQWARAADGPEARALELPPPNAVVTFDGFVDERRDRP